MGGKASLVIVMITACNENIIFLQFLNRRGKFITHFRKLHFARFTHEVFRVFFYGHAVASFAFVPN